MARRIDGGTLGGSAVWRRERWPGAWAHGVRRSWLLAVGCSVVLGPVAMALAQPAGEVVAPAELAARFDGRRAMALLETTCEFGPRPAGSEAMSRQRQWIVRQLSELGLEVQEQAFEHQHAAFDEPVTVVNLIARHRPELQERLLLACHYDTRPFPDRDPVRPQGRFIGANDGASGVALLCELARHLEALPDRYGVDLVFFDAEELVFEPKRDPLFIGSTYFAESYVREPREYVYRAGILVDMVGDKQLEIYFEKNSLRFAPELARDVWRSADELRIREFLPRPRHELRDDHLPINEIAKVPMINIVDFDYPRIGDRRSFWHTEADTPEQCSGESLRKVGSVLLHWLARQR